MTALTIVAGAQFGSEGKGAITAHLAKRYTSRDVVIRVAGPNAGHTAYDALGREWKLRAVPVGAVASNTCQLHIAAGSEIDPEVLWDELVRLDEAGFRASSRLTIHPSATIIDPMHKGVEDRLHLVQRIGSTGKGIGAARAARIMREAHTVDEVQSLRYLLSEDGPFDLSGVGRVLIEGTQGYGLGLHTENYPQVTSSNCRAIDFAAMAGIAPWDKEITDFEIVLVARVYPIRVAGNSGPLFGETTWEALGLPEERTTVTNKVRRVGAWDSDLLDEAIAANGGGRWHDKVRLALTMLDQLYPEVAGVTEPDKLSEEALVYLHELAYEHEISLDLVGTGPQTVVEMETP